MSALTVCDQCGESIEQRYGQLRLEDRRVPNKWAWLDFCSGACLFAWAGAMTGEPE